MTGWRGYLATRVWPWVVLAWAIPASLTLFLVRFLGQDWLGWPLIALLAIAPIATWWTRGRGREPAVGFFALVWLMTAIDYTVETNGITVSDITIELVGLLLFIAYWSTWAWFYKLRKLPSARIGAADKLGISIFFITGAPTFAVAIDGPDVVKQWGYLVIGLFITVFWTLGVVMAGTKGPALVQEVQDQAKDLHPWVVPWVRFYTEPSVIIVVTFGFIAVILTFGSLVPDWLSPWLGIMYLLVVIFLQMILVRPEIQTTSGQTPKTKPASTSQSSRAEGKDPSVN
jgi:hypothetical protein